MTLSEAAESTRELSEFLCKPVDEIWEEHTDASVKENFSFEEISEYLEKHPAGTN